MFWKKTFRFGVFLGALALIAGTAARAQDRKPSHCIALAQTPGIEYLHKASFAQPLPDSYTVRLSYVAHATFVLETPEGATVATDFTGFLGTSDFVPDVVTMNHAHDTHWTAFPDPRIPHVLKGWGTLDTPADHYLELRDMLVRNVTTDIRSRYGNGVERNGNSIFIFEVGGLCVGHLGHLHHEPDAGQYAAIGRLDVVMAPVDGGMTLDRTTLKRMLTRMRSSVVIPMHWFGDYTLETFIADMSETYAVDRRNENYAEISLRSLPKTPTIMVLKPRYLRDNTE